MKKILIWVQAVIIIMSGLFYLHRHYHGQCPKTKFQVRAIVKWMQDATEEIQRIDANTHYLHHLFDPNVPLLPPKLPTTKKNAEQTIENRDKPLNMK